MSSSPRISIPQPCAQPWGPMRPTVAGRHCAACATEVVDFTCLSNEEILAFLARHQGEPICARARATQLALPVPMPRWRHRLLAGLAALGLTAAPAADAAGLLPNPPPLAGADAHRRTPRQQVIVRGQVRSDLDNSPVAGARVIIEGTKFGTLTDAQGRYELVMAASFKPLRQGSLSLVFSEEPFVFESQTQLLKLTRPLQPMELNVTLHSIADLEIVGKVKFRKPPVAPPHG